MRTKFTIISSFIICQTLFASVAQGRASTFEEVTRRDTVQAYMNYVASNPNGSNTRRAYKLLEATLFKKLRVRNRLSRSGTVSCAVVTTQRSMLRLLRRSRRMIRYQRCTAFRQVQSFRNRTIYPLAIRKYDKNATRTITHRSGRTSKQKGAWKTIVVRPGRSYQLKKVLKGQGCSLRSPRIARVKGRLTALFRCPRKPRIRSASFISRVIPVHSSVYARYRKIVSRRALTLATAFVKKYPLNPLTSQLKLLVQRWLVKAEKTASSSIRLRHKYTKRPSRAYPNPYLLVIKNSSRLPLQATVKLESNKYFAVVKPRSSTTIGATTSTGKRPRYKLLRASAQIAMLPYALQAGSVVIRFGAPTVFKVHHFSSTVHEYTWYRRYQGRRQSSGRLRIGYSSTKSTPTGRRIEFSFRFSGRGPFGRMFMRFISGKWHIGSQPGAYVKWLPASSLTKAQFDSLKLRSRSSRPSPQLNL